MGFNNVGNIWIKLYATQENKSQGVDCSTSVCCLCTVTFPVTQVERNTLNAPFLLVGI